MTLEAWLSHAETALAAAGDLDAACDADWLACAALDVPRSRLRAMRGQEIEKAALDALLSRRLSGEPLQYVLGDAWFMGHRFLCDPRALIPRAETETLCELALAWLRAKPSPEVLDLCAGTGAIGVSVKLARPDARVTLADISGDALSLARENARLLGADVALAQGDLFEAVGGAKYDLILCNPPYISDAAMRNLPREVQREPRLALEGGADGLDFYRRIAPALQGHWKSGGAALFEAGSDQTEDVARVMACAGRARVYHDMQNAPRIVGVFSEGEGLLAG